MDKHELTEKEEILDGFLEELVQEIFNEIEEHEDSCYHCVIKERLFKAWTDGFEEGTLATIEKFRMVSDKIEDSLFEEE